MAYSKQIWRDGTAGGTPVSASRLNYMESGIARYSAFLDVEGEFGGGWAGVKRAVAEAQASGGPSAVVMLGRQDYAATDTITLSRPISIRGGGPRATRIRHAGTFNGPVFSIPMMKRNGEWESNVSGRPIPTYDALDDDSGPELRDFAIIDNDRSVANVQGISLQRVDDLLMDNVTFGFLTGTALKIGGDPGTGNGSVGSGCVRESDFRRIRIYRCGSGSPTGSPDIPALIVQHNDYSSGDGTNQNFFHQLRFVYNEGRMLIRQPNGSSSNLRRLIFRDSQIHALDARTFQPNQYNPFDIVTIEGDCREIYFLGLTTNGNRAGTGFFRLKAAANNTALTPKRVVIKDANAVNIYGDFLKVSQATSFVLEGMFSGVRGYLVNVAGGSGLTNYYVHAQGTSTAAGKLAGLTGSGSAWFNGQPVK
ncbi:MAG TPA: hypothetical protein VFZ64_10210 [Nocardioidaceae bacterium]